MDFQRLDEIAAKLMKKRKSHVEREIGAVYFHGKRVGTSVLELRRRIVPNDDSWDDALRCAGMFHDMCKGIEPHPKYAVILLREILKDELTAEELQQVCELIEKHDSRRENADHTVWQKLLQDADLLDHYGTQGVWMNFAYQCYVGQQSPQPLVEFYDGEWQKENAECLAMLNFEESRKIFNEKCAFEYSVIKRMNHECAGGYCV